MPSTSSSAEPTAPRRNATETLAARYRHLFVLPRTETLILFTLLASLPLSLVARGRYWAVPFLASSAAAILCAFVISSALRLADRGTIATFRRVNAVLVASQLLWLVFAATGLGFSLVTSSGQPLANAVLFGAFACSGLEFLIISGTFTENVTVSAALSAIHPVATFLILGLPQTPNQFAVAVGAGVAALAIMTAFILLLRRSKTSRGYSAVRLFQAFMKTWAGGAAADLEAIISDHAEPAEVTTKVMRFQRDDGGIFIVLPGVHPGPFFPVGSYNLPGVLSKEFRRLGSVLTLHRPGGHERNLASNDQTRGYVSQVAEFAGSIEPTKPGTIRGPLYTRIGKAAVSSSAFGDDLLLTVSFAPLGSDDLEPRVEDELSAAASVAGFDASVVDAHNSIGHEQEHPDTADPAWSRLFDLMKEAEARPLRAAYAHSVELGFPAGDDITENGIGLLMLEAGGVKSVITLADSNNAVPKLREEAAMELESAGYRFVELCTSDSHDLAAKGLTASRGYNALGEGTPVDSIRKLVLDLARLADERLAPCRYGSGRLTSSVRVLGSKALDEFASITQSSSSFAKRYFQLAVVSIAALFVLSLIL